MAEPHTRPLATSGVRGAVAHGDPEPDVQAVLGQAVMRLAQASGCPRVAAFGKRADGSAFTLAASAEATGPHEPDPELIDAVERLHRPADLGAPGFPAELGERAARAGFSAAASLGEDGAPVLLAGGPLDPPGGVRPATLAALGAAAARLAPPLQAARAAARLAALGEETRRLDALASLGELVSEIVHEVRNPLVAVKTFMQLLPDRADDPEFRTQFLEVVGEEVRRIERLLEVVLEQARPESSAAGAGAGVEPEPVLESVARLLTHRAQERGVTLAVEASAPAMVPMNSDALHQVVLNLALNALDATPEGGHVRLVAVEAEGATRIACDDEGPGIPPELRDRVFEPFFSTKRDRPGGLGLAIARRMVIESGGSIAVEARPGGGTRIALAWPRRA
ncbi:MAG: HAMP domain-containing histidine kinase [Deltaproteobacteria bacterium]|nr:HAMP domain-containing histidine kinase [Deltaproteobacteria bacterium]MBW2444539.1 HAMP domain-containing histidine kinase [Deltaproteobacteria bacterium]